MGKKESCCLLLLLWMGRRSNLALIPLIEDDNVK